MMFLASFAFAFVAALLLKKILLKRAGLVYGFLSALTILVFAAYFLTDFTTWPALFTNVVVMPIARGAMATATFAVVMYVGILPPRWKIAKTLRSIRGQLSIIGCIFALAHNIYYGMHYYTHLFTEVEELEAPYIAATLMSIAMAAIALPLGVASIKAVRKKMNPRKWMKLQRWAYPFYALIYAHTMTVMLAALVGSATNKYGLAPAIARSQMIEDLSAVIAHSAAFLPYFALRLKKGFKDKKTREAALARLASSSALS